MVGGPAAWVFVKTRTQPQVGLGKKCLFLQRIGALFEIGLARPGLKEIRSYRRAREAPAPRRK